MIKLPLAGRIQSLKDLGFELSMINEILGKYGDPQEMEKFLPDQSAFVIRCAVQASDSKGCEQ